MTGLEAIINQITGDGQKEAQEILDQAKAQTAEAMEKAKAQAAEKSAAVLKDAERQAQDIRDRAKSSAELEQRNQMLLFKQELIRETVDAARDAMENAPDGEYFDMLLDLYKRFALAGRGEMRLGARDLARLPNDFLAKMRAAVPKAEVTISPKSHPVDNGFLLVYGGVDINCTFKAVFEDAYEELRDAAGRLLFPVA